MKKLMLRLLGTLFISMLIAFSISFYRLLAYEYNFAVSILPKNQVVKLLINKDTYLSFLDSSDNINQIGYLLIAMYVVYMLFAGWKEVIEHKKYTSSENYGSHGTSRFQTKKEVESNYYKNQLGWFLGAVKKGNYKLGMKGVYHNSNALNGDVNQQVLVIGPPSTNKTTGFILPNMFHIPYIHKKLNQDIPDIVVTDPKGEIFQLTHNYYKENNYDIWVLDFQNFTYGDQLNNLDFINSEVDLMSIADGYVQSVDQALGGNSVDHFWDEQEGQVLAALLGAVKQTYPKEKNTFTETAKLLTSDELKDLDDAKEYFINHNITGAPLQLWNNFLMIAESDRTKANILGGLATKLKLFAIDKVQNLTSKSTIDLRRLGNVLKEGEKPIVLYLLMRDEDTTFAPIINITVNTIIRQAYDTARLYDSVLPRPIYFKLEEMANIGRLPKIKDLLSSMRSRRIYPMMIWQSISQLKDKYPGNEWENLISMCDMSVFLGVNDKTTANYCSDKLGNTTIRTQGISSKPKGFGVEDKTESLSYTQRPLMFPEEISRMNVKNTIILERGHFPLKIKKIQYKHWKKKNRICDKVKIEDVLNKYSKDEGDIYIEEEIDQDTVEEDEFIRKGHIEKLEEKYVPKKDKKKSSKEKDKLTFKQKLIKEKEKENKLDAEHDNKIINPYQR
jgi:type IV secretory pathway TraG/TraD family ATPase VirD4